MVLIASHRICPGRYMAVDSIFIAVASILKVFNISHAIDSQGNEIPVKASSTLGTITYVVCQCLLTAEPGTHPPGF